MQGIVVVAMLAIATVGWAETVRVQLETSLGGVLIALDADRAPASTENFLAYVRDGHYDGTVFHRVIDGFMIQGGGFSESLQQKRTRDPIANEAANGLRNLRGTIAMARTAAPHSATAQFFINVVDNAFLDHPGHDGWGYAVFGRVVDGMDTVDAISALPTGPGGPFPGDVPRPLVVIESARIVSE